MLVLKRRKGEEIIINDEIRIIVAQTAEGSCSLAIDAPDCYRIRRSELLPEARSTSSTSSRVQDAVARGGFSE